VVVKKTSPKTRSFGSKSKEIMVISMISRKDLLDQDYRRRIFWSYAGEIGVEVFATHRDGLDGYIKICDVGDSDMKNCEKHAKLFNRISWHPLRIWRKNRWSSSRHSGQVNSYAYKSSRD